MGNKNEFEKSILNYFKFLKYLKKNIFKSKFNIFLILILSFFFKNDFFIDKLFESFLCSIFI